MLCFSHVRLQAAALPGAAFDSLTANMDSMLSRTTSRLAVCFLAGCALVLAFQGYFVWQHGGEWTVLIRVGAEGKARARIESELGLVRCLDAVGHDGQINYLIARDPFDRHDTSSLFREFDNPPYRYRRILYPLLAGCFGMAGPKAAFLGLLFWSIIGGGLIAAATAELCRSWRLAPTVLILALLNPGVYLSAQVLTADTLATGLALTAVVLWQRRRPGCAALMLAAAVLTRETSLLVSLSLALTLLAKRRPRAAAFLTLTSALPWLVWSLWVSWTIPGGNGLENLSFPLAGIAASMAVWRQQGAATVVFGMVALFLAAAALVLSWRTTNRFVSCCCLLWACLALVMSREVWGQPGNALRALTPLWVFTGLAYGTCARGSRAIHNGSEIRGRKSEIRDQRPAGFLSDL